MRKRDESYFPCVGGGFGKPNYWTPGVTKFEHTVIEMAKGLLAGPDGPHNTDPSLAGFEDSLVGYQELIAQTATGYATAIWNALEKEQT